MERERDTHRNSVWKKAQSNYKSEMKGGYVLQKRYGGTLLGFVQSAEFAEASVLASRALGALVWVRRGRVTARCVCQWVMALSTRRRHPSCGLGITSAATYHYTRLSLAHYWPWSIYTSAGSSSVLFLFFFPPFFPVKEERCFISTSLSVSTGHASSPLATDCCFDNTTNNTVYLYVTVK